MNRKKKELLDIPIDQITMENLPSDEELEAMGDLEPINGSFEEFCDKVLFPNDKRIEKTKKERLQ